MKIKNNFSKISTAPLTMIFFFACLACIVIRCLQMFCFIEPSTGFTVGAEWLTAVLYVILFGCAIAFCVVSYLSKDTQNHQPQELLDKRTGVFTLIFGLFMAGDWIGSFLNCITSLETTPAGDGFRGFMSTGVVTYSAQSLFAFFSAIYIIIYAFDFFRGTKKASRFKILALAPVGWSAIRLVHRFIRQISFIEVSDLFLELVMISFTVLFFMAFAQVSSGVNSTGFQWRITGFGLSAALVCLTLNVARFVYLCVNGASSINADHPFSAVDLAFAFFAVSLVFCLNKKQETE